MRDHRNIRETILNAVAKKQGNTELNLIPLDKDYDDLTSQMMDLFHQNKTIYFQKDQIDSKLLEMFGDKKLYDRLGFQGRNQILDILKEKKIVTEYWAKENSKKIQDGIFEIEDELGTASRQYLPDWERTICSP